MITAVDTCILIDVFQGVGPFAPASAQALSQARREGQLVICELVYAELAAFAQEQAVLDELLGELGVQVAELGRDAAFTAGLRFAEYRRAGGERRHIIADFVVAAHAQHHARRLLTRDRGFFGKPFPELVLLQP
jgi:hypothetical protein